MAKIKFFVNSGANIHSKKESSILDTVKDLGLEEGEWESMPDNERYSMAEDWAHEYIEIGWTEIK